MPLVRTSDPPVIVNCFGDLLSKHVSTNEINNNSTRVCTRGRRHRADRHISFSQRASRTFSSPHNARVRSTEQANGRAARSECHFGDVYTHNKQPFFTPSGMKKKMEFRDGKSPREPRAMSY